MQTFELCSDMIDLVFDLSTIYGIQGQMLPLQHNETVNSGQAVVRQSLSTESEDFQRSPFPVDASSTATIQLSTMTLQLRQLTKSLALVCVTRAPG